MHWNHSSLPPEPPDEETRLRRKLANAKPGEREKAVQHIKDHGTTKEKETLGKLGYKL